jgi:hypothetical protein
MVRQYLTSPSFQKAEPHDEPSVKMLVTRIAALSGNPRSACWRFVRQLGVTSKCGCRQWTVREQRTQCEASQYLDLSLGLAFELLLDGEGWIRHHGDLHAKHFTELVTVFPIRFVEN